MNDVCQVVDQAKRRYESGSDKNKKARKWVNALASSITYYGGVIDTVVQYDPAHAGLAWGALKFVFSVCAQQSKIRKDVLELTYLHSAGSPEPRRASLRVVESTD